MTAFNPDALLQRGKNLLVSISGIRGIIPDGLDPVNIVAFSRAFAAVTGKRIVIGCDARPTGPILNHLLTGTLLAAGKEIIDVGLVPTPTVKAAVKTWKADGGVMISASHNPPEWNAFKLIGKEGFFFSAADSEKMIHALRSDQFPAVGWKKMGTLRSEDAVQMHIDQVIKALPNVAKIRKKKYKVVVDGVGGAGREALPRLLKSLGCTVITLYCEPTKDGSFPRPPEPTPSALSKFGALVKKKKAAVGFALDPDADRLVTGSPTSGAVNEEYTLPLALLGMPSKKVRSTDSVVLNLSTSTLVDAVMHARGGRVFRAAVGEANVVADMVKRKAFFGGEGNGGVIHPLVPSYGRDSLIGAGLILSAMAASDAKSIDDLLDCLPDLHMDKRKFELSGQSMQDIKAGLKQRFPKGRFDERDGIHITLPAGAWVHARSSNTEPVLRIIAQAESKKALEQLIAEAAKALRS
ncbi:MAG: phosphoglucosamine mutase [Spirochaetia bacterium]|nr:phosphoglucosamine mutase [Spirochaetia bacterium]